jgi:DNA-binding NtrC family response regulator
LRLSRLTRELIETNRQLAHRAAELTAEIERRQRAETALQNADSTLTALSDLEADRWRTAGLIGSSSEARRVLGEIHRLCQFPTTSVLITGESGTGKELVARGIHFGGARARAPFVPVNCVAIPAELAESMLFGHLKGSFTGATSDRKGYFELAHGGTLFLDEIGDMPASLQVKLLRVLEDGCIQPVGSAAPRKIDVRIIAATNADLAQRIDSGAFRQDLYFRLARYVVATSPLRERLEDVPQLVDHFLRTLAPEMGLKSPPISPQALRKLQTYDFPGNVRELRNIIERALIQSGGETIEPAHLHLMARAAAGALGTAERRAPAVAAGVHELPLSLAEAEDLLIQRALQETGGNIADAARLLGVHRTRIYRKLAR